MIELTLLMKFADRDMFQPVLMTDMLDATQRQVSEAANLAVDDSIIVYADQCGNSATLVRID